MRVVSINKYQVVYYDKKNQLLKCEWLEDTSSMSVQKFRKETERVMNFSLKFKPTSAMIDISKFNYELDINDMNWFGAIYTIDIVKKIAIIIEPNNEVQMQNTEQFVNKSTIMNRKSQIFTNEFLAMQWLEVTHS